MKIESTQTKQELMDLIHDLESRSFEATQRLVEMLQEGYIYKCINKEIFNKVEEQYKRVKNLCMKNTFHYLAQLNILCAHEASLNNIWKTSLCTLAADTVKNIQEGADGVVGAERFIKKLEKGLGIAMESHLENIKL